MMGRMTTVAEGNQIGRLITAAGRPRHQVVDISFGSIARLFAFDTLESVAPKYTLANSPPIRLDFTFQLDLTHWIGASENSVSSNVRTAAGVLNPFATKRSAISLPLKNIMG